MKTYRSQAGPFAERPYYEEQELESIATDELRKVNLMPVSPGPVRVERFIEKRFGVVPQYDDLPESILGFTRFGKKGPDAVVLARVLADEGTLVSERRLNSTLAHEAGHMLLHSHLFFLERGGAPLPLLDDDLDEANQRILCRIDIIGPSNEGPNRPRYDGRWWEFQANQMIGPLLMPRSLVRAALEPMLVPSGGLGATTLDPSRGHDATRLLADVFAVNPAAARVRLGKLFPAPGGAQLPL